MSNSFEVKREKPKEEQVAFPPPSPFLKEDVLASRGITQEFIQIEEKRPTGMMDIINDVASSDLSSSASETTIKSQKLFFTRFIKGRALVVKASGVYSTASGTPTFTLRFKTLEAGSSATTHHTITSTAASVTDAPWSCEWVMTVPTIGVSGSLESYLEAKINNVNKDSGRSNAATFNTSAMQELRVTAQWSASNANNVFKCRQFLIFLV